MRFGHGHGLLLRRDFPSNGQCQNNNNSQARQCLKCHIGQFNEISEQIDYMLNCREEQ